MNWIDNCIHKKSVAIILVHNNRIKQMTVHYDSYGPVDGIH